MSKHTPNKYDPSLPETQAALDRVNKAIENAVNQKVGRLAQITVALVHKIGDFDVIITEEELNGAAGWYMELEKLDKAVRIRTAPPQEQLEQIADQPMLDDKPEFIL
jgi:hypothetical protein